MKALMALKKVCQLLIDNFIDRINEIGEAEREKEWEIEEFEGTIEESREIDYEKHSRSPLDGAELDEIRRLENVEIITKTGKSTMKTGFNLALFGEPGTGKTFATYNIICGNPNKGIPAHGLPGKNRYCGGITPVKFIEIGKAYEGRIFNFIVTEFNDWFQTKGMVEPLKLAMERGQIRRETARGIIGPYRFDSF